MASGQPVVLPLAKEADLYSQRDGTPNIYWSDPKSWPVSAGARLIRVRAFVADMQDYGNTDDPQNVHVKLFAQESIDGKTWRFVRAPGQSAPIDFFGGRRALTGANYDSSSAVVEPFFTNNIMPPNGDFSPLVRYGLQVQHANYSSGAQSQVYVRLTCELEITTSEPFTMAEGVTQVDVTTTTTDSYADSDAVVSTWGPIAINGQDAMAAATIATGASGSLTAYTLYLEHSFDGTNWFEVDSAAMVGTLTSSDEAAVALAVSSVNARFLRLRYSATGATDASQSVELIVRGNQ